ncbi:MAG: hypothetical protein J5I94_07370 [Phaeodactylibacter sp.]|nr:hypothetical protein [Phaeodactylibacter sp.]
MRLLGAFFNIFFFYYFFALCGSAEGQAPNGAESVEAQPAQSVRQQEKPCKPGEDSCQLDLLSYSSTANRLVIPFVVLTDAT